VNDTLRRLYPRPWDHDYLLMRRLAFALRALIASHLDARTDLTVVDYGCGPMPYRTLFEGRTGRYFGADLPDNPAADIHLDPQGRLPLADNSVDVVLSSQVLEHVLDVDAYLDECRRVLRKSGLLLLSTHGSWIYHPQPTDVRRWTRWGLVYDIERHGFAVKGCEPCVGPLAYTTQLRLLFLTGLLAKSGLVGRIVTAPFTVLCQALMWLGDLITPAWLTRENACVYVIAALRD
jgi:SAM-dependent methyltransferase